MTELVRLWLSRRMWRRKPKAAELSMEHARPLIGPEVFREEREAAEVLSTYL
jgi:hypothetical protein